MFGAKNSLGTVRLPTQFSALLCYYSFSLHSNKKSGVPSMLDIKSFPPLPEADPIKKSVSLHN